MQPITPLRAYKLAELASRLDIPDLLLGVVRKYPEYVGVYYTWVTGTVDTLQTSIFIPHSATGIFTRRLFPDGRALQALREIITPHLNPDVTEYWGRWYRFKGFGEA